MKKIIFTTIFLLCMLTSGYSYNNGESFHQDDDVYGFQSSSPEKQDKRKLNMRSSSTRSTVHNNSGSSRGINSGYSGSTRFSGQNLRSSDTRRGIGSTNMTRSTERGNSRSSSRNFSGSNSRSFSGSSNIHMRHRR